ncbi:unnamed protein product [Cyprideis torosa]|uniref:Uncharacterized protein n=1 Tax=Cyprideis torosa TaxID=163714 RepID=A0A7R8W471_9CRUS|nr:unnamed protein product [Cyprideis torosa]CAG0883865.1 unnamed protein product [Cyprideis torosa]
MPLPAPFSRFLLLLLYAHQVFCANLLSTQKTPSSHRHAEVVTTGAETSENLQDTLQLRESTTTVNTLVYMEQIRRSQTAIHRFSLGHIAVGTLISCLISLGVLGTIFIVKKFRTGDQRLESRPHSSASEEGDSTLTTIVNTVLSSGDGSPLPDQFSCEGPPSHQDEKSSKTALKTTTIRILGRSADDNTISSEDYEGGGTNGILLLHQKKETNEMHQLLPPLAPQKPDCKAKEEIIWTKYSEQISSLCSSNEGFFFADLDMEQPYSTSPLHNEAVDENDEQPFGGRMEAEEEEASLPPSFSQSETPNFSDTRNLSFLSSIFDERPSDHKTDTRGGGRQRWSQSLPSYLLEPRNLFVIELSDDLYRDSTLLVTCAKPLRPPAFFPSFGSNLDVTRETSRTSHPSSSVSLPPRLQALSSSTFRSFSLYLQPIVRASDDSTTPSFFSDPLILPGTSEPFLFRPDGDNSNCTNSPSPMPNEEMEG